MPVPALVAAVSGAVPVPRRSRQVAADVTSAVAQGLRHSPPAADAILVEALSAEAVRPAVRRKWTAHAGLQAAIQCRVAADSAVPVPVLVAVAVAPGQAAVAAVVPGPLAAADVRAVAVPAAVVARS